MLAHPGYWQSHYRGDPDDQRVLRHFSYSDRIRYYWASPAPQEAVRRLLDRLTGTSIPEPLISQFLPTLYPRVASGALDPDAQDAGARSRSRRAARLRGGLRHNECRGQPAASTIGDEYPARLGTTCKRQASHDSHRRCNEQ